MSIAMVVKNQPLLQDLYASIAMVVKNQPLLQDLYASIAMVVGTSHYYKTYIRVLQRL
jgi:hypothetical protein